MRNDRHCNRSTCGARWVLAAHGVLSQDQLLPQLPIPSQRCGSFGWWHHFVGFAWRPRLQLAVRHWQQWHRVTCELSEIVRKHCCYVGPCDRQCRNYNPDHQGPSGEKTSHLLCRQLLQGCVILQQGKLATQKVIPTLFHTIDRSQTLPLDDTVVSLCRCQGLTSICNDMPILLQNCTDFDCASISLQAKGWRGRPEFGKCQDWSLGEGPILSESKACWQWVSQWSGVSFSVSWCSGAGMSAKLCTYWW